jgi:UDP-N-acetylglucosamine 2-epimerase (non-hydrolysing)
MRDETERPELLTSGAGVLVGNETRSIVHNTMKILDDSELHYEMSHAMSPFGNGHAAKIIVTKLHKYLS